MSVLAKASCPELEALCDALKPLPNYEWLRRPETGLVMVRARIGGTGAKFNLGEMSLTRCALRLSTGTIGFAYVQGRSKRHAELAAIIDGLMQEETSRARVQAAIVTPLERAQNARRDLVQRKAAATRVEFYTVARSGTTAAAGGLAGSSEHRAAT